MKQVHNIQHLRKGRFDVPKRLTAKLTSDVSSQPTPVDPVQFSAETICSALDVSRRRADALEKYEHARKMLSFSAAQAGSVAGTPDEGHYDEDVAKGFKNFVDAADDLAEVLLTIERKSTKSLRPHQE